MPKDRAAYERLQKMQEEAWESRCGRCGACCGAYDGDPCEHLRRDESAKSQGYYCSIYHHRFGIHKTVSGKEIRCVPIRQILQATWPGDECCGYKK